MPKFETMLSGYSEWLAESWTSEEIGQAVLDQVWRI